MVANFIAMDHQKNKSPGGFDDNKINDHSKSEFTFDEVSLWDDFRKGDEAAYIKIYEAYFDLLLNLGFQICHKVELVEDTIQDVFIDLRIKRKTLPGIKHSLKYYLITVFKNKLIRYIDREKWLYDLHKKSLIDSFQFVQSSEHIMVSNQDYDEKIIKLERATKALTPKEREVIYYYFNLNMSYEEIKDVLNLQSVKTTRNLLYRALKHLRNLLFILLLLL